MLILLRQYELNTIVRRRDDSDYADLTKAKVLANSLRFSEDQVRQALETALGGDFILHLDLRILPDSTRALAGQAPETLPPLDLPDPERFVYREQPQTQALKTYRLEYLLRRTSRDVAAPYEEGVGDDKVLVHPAPGVEEVHASLECDVDDLRSAVQLLAAPANGSLLWLRVTVHDDAFGVRPYQAGQTRFAEPGAQITF